MTIHRDGDLALNRLFRRPDNEVSIVRHDKVRIHVQILVVENQSSLNNDGVNTDIHIQ